MSLNQIKKALRLLLLDTASAVLLGSKLWRTTVERKEEKGIVVAGGHLPSFQASAVALLLHDDLLGWALLILHLIISIMSAARLLPNPCF